jgi:AcrR family transcriptional regulator
MKNLNPGGRVAARRAASRPRGRPRKATAPDARALLLGCARELFVKYGYRAVSGRQIAKRAGVNPALVSYYFAGKYGLYREVLQAALAPLLAVLEEGSGEAATLGLVSNYMRMLAANPWIAGLVLREVLAPNGPWRSQFIDDFPARIAPRATAAIQHAIENGQFRADLDPKLATLSCISLAVMPFIAAPILGGVFGIDPLGRDTERLIEHTLRVLRAGLGAPADAAPVRAPRRAPARPKATA